MERKSNISLIILAFILILILIFLPTINIKAEEAHLKVSTLLSNSSKYNGKNIRFIGEVIGEPLGRGDYKWINILDEEGNAIGVWLKVELIKEIKYYGKYKVKGDIVEVEGIYHSICNEHGGDTDIHANSINLIKKGYLIKEQVLYQKFYIILLEGITLLIVLIVLRIKKYYESLSK